MIVSILSTAGSQGLLKLFQIRLQTAAFIYKAWKPRSFSVRLFLGYSRKFQSSHLFPEHLLLAGPLRRSCLQGKKFCLREEEGIRTICNFVNVCVFFLFFFFFFIFQLKGELEIFHAQPSRLGYEISLFSLLSVNYVKYQTSLYFT